MTKIIKRILILFVLVASLCLLFPSAFIKANAVVEGISGNKIVLTGLIGNTPKHFFEDNNKQSTLVNCDVVAIQDKYYSIKSTSNEGSSGWAEYKLTGDMQPFIEKGLLYAQATAEVTSTNTDVSLQISSGENSKTKKGNGELKTDLIQITSNQNIRFSFYSSPTNGRNEFVLSLPTIHLYTIINSVTLNEEDQVVSPGQLVKINAYNDVTSLDSISGNFMSFSKINHKIRFEFLNGEEYVTIVGTNLSISKNAPNGAEITFKVYSNKNSYDSTKIYAANEVTLTVDANNVAVKVITDFENPARFFGEDIYTPGRKITLTVDPNPDFEFVGWYVDGQLKQGETLITQAISGQVIYAKFIKSISIKQIIVPDKVYDKTTAITEETISAVFNGLESQHELKLLGSEFAFSDANAGENKSVFPITDEITLTGKNADIYVLKTQDFQNSFGRILKRDALVTPQTSQKQYGYTDPLFNYQTKNVLEGDVIVGKLGRAQGEEIGIYPFALGELAIRNPNYNLQIEDGAYFEIIQRELELEDVVVNEKTYDKTKVAGISANLRNIYNNEDVSVIIEAEFVSPNAGSSIEVFITSTTLVGEDKDNYTLAPFSQQLFGEIEKKPIDVKAKDTTATYGDTPNLEYDVTGLCEGDYLNGSLQVNETNVGEHEIKRGDLSNDNYVIQNFESAICTIIPREIQVYAKALSKSFGDEDPELTYETENMVEGDTLEGSLKREGGEDVGVYAIEVGDLKNENYTIFFTTNDFTITQREIEAIIEFLDKEYDGTTDAKYKVEYNNNIKNEIFDIVVDATLSSKDCGLVTIDVNSSEAQYSGKQNYTFKYQYKNNQIKILKREVNIFVDNLSKEYGGKDPDFTYSARNLVDNDSLNLTIEREEGEIVGQYKYSLYEDYVELNPNYNITLIESSFSILPREMRVEIGSFSKEFGNKDPELTYNIIDEFCFGDTKEEVVNGTIKREAGENVGVYNYDLTEISSNKNYVFTNASESYFIINKRAVFVTIEDATKVYGEEDPVYHYSVSNEVEGEKLYVEITREYGEDVGDYTLECKMKNDPRYTFTYKEANLKITPYAISIRADEKVKIYGDEDPEFTISITKGVLRNNDRTEDLLQGNLIREDGEGVGNYQINLGSLSLGDNYELTFESGNLEILQRHITITADRISKYYGDDDPQLSFSISSEGLVFDDKVEGGLLREEGENVGEYKILQGDLSLNENYQFDFVEGELKIIRKKIQIIPTTLSKEYGEEDTTIEYKIIGDLVGDDTLDGELYRQGIGEEEEVGKYLIISTLNSQNYQISFSEHYFTILPREIVVKAENCQIHYGDEEPELKYQIVSGTILEGDSMTGGLTRLSGNSAGNYDIISSLSLGRNYTIQYIKGVVTILPLEITIKSPDYTKIYGQADPTFTYEVVDGELINDDKLYGTIIREKGEDVGTYNLEKGIYNVNYNITLLPAKLEILKKDVYMISTVYNKIYDGTTVAILKNPYISGVLDNVYLDFDRDNSANFISADVGENIGVKVHDVMLVGEKAGNYNLILPEMLYADITLKDLTNEEVVLSAKDPILYSRYSLEIASEDITEDVKVKNHSIVKKYNIWLEEGSQIVNLDSQYTIKIGLPKKIFAKYNIYIYQKDERGEYKMLTSQKNVNNEIVVTTYSLGEFYIAVEDEAWLDIGAIIAVVLISVTCVVAIVYTVIKQKKRKKQLDY